MTREQREPIISKEPITAEIDLSEAWDKQSMIDMVIEKLKELRIYQPNLIYRGFDGKRIEIMKKNGTDDPDDDRIFCSTESELMEENYEDQSAFNFIGDKGTAGMAVYDSKKLKPTVPFKYKARDGGNLKEALVAVLTLK